MTTANVLSGVRVLDLARYIAGPYCATLLGALGADVIRIEKPGGGEDRSIGPVGASASAVYLMTGCNKRSMTLDLKHPAAHEVVARLVRDADVVIANMPPAALGRMGLDYASLCALKPDIILTTQTAFGHRGPWAERGGFDGLGQVMSGSAFLSGTPGAPARSATPYVDYSTAVLGAFGTLAALYHRRDSGQGQHVQASLLGTALAAFSAPLIEQALLAVNRVPSGNRGQTSAPTDLFATVDGFIMTQVLGPGLFARVAQAIGAPEWITNPVYASDKQRGDRRDEICERVGAWCRTRTRDEVIDIMATAGVPCGPVLDLDEAMAHPQALAMGILGAVTYPDCSKPAPVARVPLDFSVLTPPQVRPPLIGEHTDEVLAEVGYDAASIARLRATRVV
ncbi:MAG: CoA transferase [Gammaproteobacteria bacterium]|nr:CoA transferase [Gammaproteobacteria bacterium]